MSLIQKGIEMISLGIRDVDGFVNKQQRKGVNVRWDGWNMVFFKENENAQFWTNGTYLNGKWGTQTIVGPNSAGNWMVKTELLRR